MKPIANSILIPLLRGAVVGEVIETGVLFPGLDSERLTWVVAKHTETETEHHLELHAYVYEVFVVMKPVTVHASLDEISWGRTLPATWGAAHE